jgi:hypothetical protein
MANDRGTEPRIIAGDAPEVQFLPRATFERHCVTRWQTASFHRVTLVTLDCSIRFRNDVCETCSPTGIPRCNSALVLRAGVTECVAIDQFQAFYRPS